MELNINNTGQYGVIKDVPAHELPPNAWSGGVNMHFVNGIARKIPGFIQVYGTPNISPYFLMPVSNGDNYFWLYAGLTQVHAVSGSTHYNISRSVGGNYGATADNVWTGGVLHGIGILNNPLDVPQMWNPVLGTQVLQALTNWPANTFARSLRPFKNYLVALDLVKASVRYPQMVKWSDAADPGTVPSTWDPADATKRAGEIALSETNDFCVDCVPLRDINVIYKENSTWGMQFIGGISVFRFFRLFGEQGILSRNCAVEYINGRHAVFGADDIYVHDGQNMQSILSDRLREWIYKRIDATNSERCFVALNYFLREVMFCYPTNGSVHCIEAAVWNFEKNTVSIRELPNIAHMMHGVVDTDLNTNAWDTDTQTWDQDTTTWGDVTFDVTNRSLLMASPGNTKLYQANKSNAFAGAAFEASLERVGLGIPTYNNQGPPDHTSRKLVTRLWPRIQGTLGGLVKIRVGGQETPQAPVEWGPEKNFIIGTTEWIEPMFNTKLIAVQFKSNSNIDWQLDGYTMDIAKVGKF